jgi:hypothetical protein
MAINLTAYTSIQTNFFVKLVIPGYSTLTFSDYHKELTIDSVNYTGLGELLSVNDTDSNLRAAPQELSLAISGIPSGNISDILNNKVKGSEVTVYRGFFDVETGELLSISGNPTGKFRGIVSNFEISDELESGSDTGTISLILTCTNVVEQLNNKVAGRRTNPIDQKLYYPTDESMDRVVALTKSNFNFGAPK